MSWLTNISSLSEFDASGRIATPIVAIGWISTVLMAVIAGLWLARFQVISLTPQHVLLIGIPGLLYHGLESSLQLALRLGKTGDISGGSAFMAVVFTSSLFVGGFFAFTEVLVQTVAGRAALIIAVSSLLYVPNWAYRKQKVQDTEPTPKKGL